jgi:hypothetical protein
MHKGRFSNNWSRTIDLPTSYKGVFFIKKTRIKVFKIDLLR